MYSNFNGKNMKDKSTPLKVAISNYKAKNEGFDQTIFDDVRVLRIIFNAMEIYNEEQLKLLDIPVI